MQGVDVPPPLSSEEAEGFIVVGEDGVQVRRQTGEELGDKFGSGEKEVANPAQSSTPVASETPAPTSARPETTTATSPAPTENTPSVLPQEVRPAPTELPKPPIEQQTPAQVWGTVVEWLQHPENIHSVPPMTLSVAVALARDKVMQGIRGLQQEIPDEPGPEFVAKARSITEQWEVWTGLNQAYDQLSQQFDQWMERNLDRDAREAKTEEEADAALSKRFDKSTAAEQSEVKSRLEKYKELLIGFGGMKLKEAWHLNDGASLQTLLDFLIRGGERGYGASGWKKPEEEEKPELLVDRSVFKELLQNKPAELAQLLDRAATSSNEQIGNLYKLGWPLSSDEKKLLSELARTPDVEKLKKELPKFLEKLNRFFVDDPDSGVRWQKAKVILARALPGNIGDGKQLPEVSGFDLFTSSKEQWWKHWKS